NGPLKIRLPEDAEALLEVHNTNSAVNCLTHTLGDLAADEVVDGQRQSEQKHLSAVLRAGSPLEDWVQRVSDLRHGGVEMSAEGAICSSACAAISSPKCQWRRGMNSGWFGCLRTDGKRFHPDTAV